ncbi:MAG: universal stress protein [Dehalococcoidia bacterium]|nr:MAG: universal stress protein [Dehalococcoidia bacterium]
MYKKILVPLDGSELAECALEHVRAIARGCQVDKVVLLRVLEPVIGAPHDSVSAEHVRQAEGKLEADAEEYLNKVAGNLKKDGIPAEAELVLGGEPAAKIIKSAKKDEATLIIMSTHGRSGVSNWLFGSVAERVVHHSPVPILMVVARSCRLG